MMTADKTKSTNMAQYFGGFKDRWMPWSKVNIVGDNLHYATIKSGQWFTCDAEQLPTFTLFAKLALLLPASVCAYRIRTFPKHLLNAKELNEAIVLDLAEWSPWGKASGYCYSYTITADEWQVSTWVWDLHYAQQMSQQLPYCTHIIPELAWHAACAPQQPALMVIPEASGFHYLLLGELGKIQANAHINTQQQALRCWHGWGMPNLSLGWEVNQPQDYWRPETINMKALPDNHNKPHANLLRITRVAGIRDWTDPASYQAIFTLLLISLFSWMAIDALVLNYQSQKIQQQLSEIRSSADDALVMREQVEGALETIEQARLLQKQQRRPEQLLAQLSTQIPTDIYLRRVQIEGDQLDLEGQGKQVARLMVLLEKLPDVAKVMLINDIRRNTETDQELFQIRLLLKSL